MIKNIVVQLSKFVSTGALGTIAHYCVLVGAVELLAVKVFVASAIGAIVGATVNYWLSYIYVFKSKSRHMQSGVRFAFMALAALAMNFIGVWLLTEVYTTDYRVAQVISTGGVLSVNFLVCKYFVFKSPNEKGVVSV